MLRLFHSIFGGEVERYTDALIEAATERAVDGTDPWLRGLAGYRRKLRPAILHALDHVVSLADALHEPIELSREKYGKDPQLRLFFISAEQMESLVRTEPTLSGFRRETGFDSRPAQALLTMELEQRRVFGVDMIGETIAKDVPQTTVGMTGHRFLDPALDLAETRRLLKRRAFDHLLTLALSRILSVEDVREELLTRRTLLQAKHDTLEGSGWGFSHSGESALPLDEIHRQLDEIEAQLLEVGGEDRYIEKHLEILVDVLSNAERQIWAQPLRIIVDRMGIRRNVATEDAPELELTELHNAAGRRLVVQMVAVPAT